MATDGSMGVKDAVHKVQLSLLEGIRDEKQLFAAGSLMSLSDYQDVVTERAIADKCGYPLCRNSLPKERSKKGRYRISLKEHKVYDLQETYSYCCTICVVSSRAFAGSLPDERCSQLNSAKLNEVLKLVEGTSLHPKKDLGKNGDIGLSKLTIQEKTDIKKGEVSFEEWVDSSDAIEGYIPKREHSSKPQYSKSDEKGPITKSKHGQLNNEKHITFNDMDFTSTIITQDEYAVSKSPVSTVTRSSEGREGSKSKTKSLKPAGSARSPLISKSLESGNSISKDLRNDDASDGEDLNVNASGTSGQMHPGKELGSDASVPKSSLKSSDSKKIARSVTWADEKTGCGSSNGLCDYEEKRIAGGSGISEKQGAENSYRLASAEACAEALTLAAEAVSSGESDISGAVSEAGIIILPPHQEMDECGQPKDDGNELNTNQIPSKWPSKPGTPNYDLFDSQDSWYDNPPEGFNLALSPFATMFMALFAWISSSSLAYIYGRDESCHEEYLSVNGKEYPCKAVSTDGRSSEIKQTLAGCLARALPGLASDLRLPIPVSILEQGMAGLLDTMSFIDPLPSFRMKQWQVIVHLFLDALSISRIPALTPYMTGRRILLPKILDGASISAEEYEIMKDLIIPLGRVPQLSSQCGG